MSTTNKLIVKKETVFSANFYCAKVISVIEPFCEIPSTIGRFDRQAIHLMGDMTFRGDTAIGWYEIISWMASIEPVIIPNMVMTLWIFFVCSSFSREPRIAVFRKTKKMFFFIHSKPICGFEFDCKNEWMLKKTIYFVVAVGCKCELSFVE